jgi:hypothetical protein
MQLPRFFVGGYQELKRPQNVVDETLMTRIEQARLQLQLSGKQVTPVLGRAQVARVRELATRVLQEAASR